MRYVERPRASSDDARIGSAAFFAPDTRTSPCRRAPPRMTIFCKTARGYLLKGQPHARVRPSRALRGSAALGGRRRGPGGRRDAGVLVAQAALRARLPARFLAADLVTMVVAHVAAPPGDEVLSAVTLGAHRLLAALDAAGRSGVLGRRLLRPCGLGGLIRLGGFRGLVAAGLAAGLAGFFLSSFSVAIGAQTICGQVGAIKPGLPDASSRLSRGPGTLTLVSNETASSLTARPCRDRYMDPLRVRRRDGDRNRRGRQRRRGRDGRRRRDGAAEAAGRRRAVAGREPRPRRARRGRRDAAAKVEPPEQPEPPARRVGAARAEQPAAAKVEQPGRPALPSRAPGRPPPAP